MGSSHVDLLARFASAMAVSTASRLFPGARAGFFSGIFVFLLVILILLQCAKDVEFVEEWNQAVKNSFGFGRGEFYIQS